MGLFLEKGERGLLVGQTGSGKTQNAIFQLKNAPVFPVLVFDTKIEDAFFALPSESESIDLIESVEDFGRYAKQPREKMADFVLIRPGVHEIQDFDALDEYCRIAYESFGACTVYFDELYNWHNRGVPVNNFVGLLTRGRSRGKTVLQSTQRPGWISRFCFTESQKFYIHRLIDNRDRKTLDSMVPEFSSYPQPQKFGFYFYEVGESDAPVEYLPVPYTRLDRSKVFRRKWL
jgi:hypothetical protein